MPYTYLIGWSQLNRWYYGVRYAKGCHPKELWVNYFTSSKHVLSFRQEHGEPDVIEIRKTFASANEARLWESQCIKKLQMVTDEKWINKHDPNGSWYVKGPLSEEHKQALRKPKQNSLQMGRYERTEEWKQRQSNAAKERWVGESNPSKKQKNRQALSQRQTGINNVSCREDVKQIKSKKRKGKTPVYDLVENITKVIPTDQLYGNRDRYISTRSKQFKEMSV